MKCDTKLPSNANCMAVLKWYFKEAAAVCGKDRIYDGKAVAEEGVRALADGCISYNIFSDHIKLQVDVIACL